MRPPVRIACEGQTDLDAITRVCRLCGIEIGDVYPVGGKQKLDLKLAGYIGAAHYAPWIVQRDLDYDATCAPALASFKLPQRPDMLNFLVTVRQTESWFLADQAGLASFLRVNQALIPSLPEERDDPKRDIVSLARRSKSSAMREGIVPAPESGRKTGPRYGEFMAEFIRDHWSIEHAIAGGARSLAKLVERIECFKRTGVWSR